MSSETQQNSAKLSGNICNTKKKDISKTRAWAWTWNNYTENDVNDMITFCENKCNKWGFQEETGTQQTQHLQGFWYFKIK